MIVLHNIGLSQTIWTETFSNGCASACLATSYGGWTETLTGANGADANIWYISGAECGNNVGACGTACGGANPSLHIGSAPTSMGDVGAAYDAGGLCGFLTCPQTNKRIQSPTINCTGYSNIVLSFNFIHNGNQPGKDEGSVVYFDGSTWSTLGILPRTVGICTPQGYWTNYTIDLPSSANNNPNVKIGFNWMNNDDGTGTDPSVAVDNISIYVKPVFCYNSAYASYTGGGCTANCVLSEFAGLTAMCTVSSGCGACPATGPVATQLFTIPAGCSATITASFQRRCNGIGCDVCTSPCNNVSATSGCCNSGMDANDYLKVGGSLAATSSASINLSPGYTSACGGGAGTTAFALSGNTITATGSNNGGAILQWAQTGGVLFLEQRANRMDEIVTFTVAITSTCTCKTILPVDIVSFWAEPQPSFIDLRWLVKNEKNLLSYKIEKSYDGIAFMEVGKINAQNTEQEKVYELIDDNPQEGISYYRLSTINKDLTNGNYIVRDVLYKLEYTKFSYYQQGDILQLHFNSTEINNAFVLYDLTGKIIYTIPIIETTEYNINTSAIPKGLYVGSISSNNGNVGAYKVLIY